MTAPHDVLRQGLATLKDGAAATHPVETIQKQAAPSAEAARLEMLRNLYGTALPARLQIERQILDRCARGCWGGVHGGGGCRTTAATRLRTLPRWPAAASNSSNSSE
jgi:hypothetical protein